MKVWLACYRGKATGFWKPYAMFLTDWGAGDYTAHHGHHEWFIWEGEI